MSVPFPINASGHYHQGPFGHSDSLRLCGTAPGDQSLLPRGTTRRPEDTNPAATSKPSQPSGMYQVQTCPTGKPDQSITKPPAPVKPLPRQIPPPPPIRPPTTETQRSKMRRRRNAKGAEEIVNYQSSIINSKDTDLQDSHGFQTTHHRRRGSAVGGTRSTRKRPHQYSIINNASSLSGTAKYTNYAKASLAAGQTTLFRSRLA